MRKPGSFSSQIYELNEFGLIKIKGKDAERLLQGQLTCHIGHVKLGSTRFSAHCNPRGRIISLFYICHYQESFFLFMPKSLVPLEMSALKKYAVFYQVEISDLTQTFKIIAYINPNRDLLIDHIITFNIQNLSSDEQIFHQVFAGEPQAIQVLCDQLKEEANVELCNTNEWKCRNISALLPQIYPETSEKWLPHEINLPKLNGVDFDKGCYTGQEIIARMHYLGKLKTEMYHAYIENQPQIKPGADIYSLSGPDQKIIVSGKIVDCSLDKNNKHHALIITDKNNAKDDHLFLEQDQGHFKLART